MKGIDTMLNRNPPSVPIWEHFFKKKFFKFPNEKKSFFFAYFCSNFEVKYSFKKISEIRHLRTKKNVGNDEFPDFRPFSEVT